MRIKIEIKKIKGQQQIFNLRVKLKRMKNINKRKKTKRTRIKVKKKNNILETQIEGKN